MTLRFATLLTHVNSVRFSLNALSQFLHNVPDTIFATPKRSSNCTISFSDFQFHNVLIAFLQRFLRMPQFCLVCTPLWCFCILTVYFWGCDIENDWFAPLSSGCQNLPGATSTNSNAAPVSITSCLRSIWVLTGCYLTYNWGSGGIVKPRNQIKPFWPGHFQNTCRWSAEFYLQ